MASVSSNQTAPTILIAGASRGLGHAMAAEFLKRGWHVIGTVRGGGRTLLHGLAEDHPDRIEIETLDINELDQIAALPGLEALHPTRITPNLLALDPKVPPPEVVQELRQRGIHFK